MRESTGEQVYEGPDSDLVPGLVAATIEELEARDAPVLIRAAMAHLNLVMVHPFRDGSGRMARALQTLVLAREQIMAPVFASIEEYLGRNTDAYYDVLGKVGQGSCNPDNDARPWVRFCLTAHYHQARTQVRRVQETERLYEACGALAAERGLPDRATGALVEAAYGLRLTNATYRMIVELTAGEEVSRLTVSRDLKAVVEAKLVEPSGRLVGAIRGATNPARAARAHSGRSGTAGNERSVRDRNRPTPTRNALNETLSGSPVGAVGPLDRARKVFQRWQTSP